MFARLVRDFKETVRGPVSFTEQPGIPIKATVDTIQRSISNKTYVRILLPSKHVENELSITSVRKKLVVLYALLH